MQRKLTIKIGTPCDEDWSQMTPEGDGSYCTHCRKHVIDFTGWDDARLYRYFQANKDKKVCGRFYESQLDAPISLPQPVRAYRVAAALGFTLLFIQGSEAKRRLHQGYRSCFIHPQTRSRKRSIKMKMIIKGLAA